MRQRQRHTLKPPEGCGHYTMIRPRPEPPTTINIQQGSVNAVSQTRKRRLFPCARREKKKIPKPEMCLNTNITPGRSAPSLHSLLSALPLEEASKVSGIHILSYIKHQFRVFFHNFSPKWKKKTKQQTNQQAEMMELFKCIITFW